jgi:4-aminobutyrate aminotransferase / (S)-3-amino-2-methylpropionate transaminase / 5-aminovalerate transaminase
MSAPGQELPRVHVLPPGPLSLAAWANIAAQAPMGPRTSGGTIVLSHGVGANLFDLDGNRYVDLAAGFGALLLGHAPEELQRALVTQGQRLWQAMGDVLPSDTKLELLGRLAALHPEPGAQVILGQSGADAVTAAVKSAVLFSGKTGLLAFRSSYHGLSYGALAVTDLRRGYRDPFSAHLPDDVHFSPYPGRPEDVRAALADVEAALAARDVAAIIVEPILGRGGVVVPPTGFLTELGQLARSAGALIIADEIWTGLGRAGSWLATSTEPGLVPDLICLGKGLGGGLPLSACIGRKEVMAAWSQEQEVVHTSTFAGAPLASALCLATLDTIESQGLVLRSATLGREWQDRLAARVAGERGYAVRGRGLMLGIECGALGAVELHRRLLARGFVTSTGGGQRDVLVLTPPLTVTPAQLEAFDDALLACLSA